MFTPRNSITFVCLFMLVLLSPGLAYADLESDLRDCASIRQDAARLACFDGLSEGFGAAAVVADVQPQAEAEVSATPAAAANESPASVGPPVQSLSDDVGRAATGPTAARDKQKESWSAAVTGCDEAVDGKMLFYFENGQIWKQSKSRRVSVKDCAVQATLEKDLFGFKMELAGYDRTIRVRRIR